ncbi:MAG TPA: alpha/beta fold hydrolase, partial [Bryobacteraceae bacterium]
MPTVIAPVEKRVAEEKYFTAGDGVQLFYRHWAHGSQTPGTVPRAVVLMHRGHEHSGRIMHLVDELNLPDYAMFAWDARGHGHSREAEASNPTLSTFVNDLDCFIRHISDTHGIEPENIAVVAQSVGAVLAATWVHDYAPRIRCLILASPAFKVKLYVPFARPSLKMA